MIWLGPSLIVLWTIFFLITKDRLEIQDTKALIDVQAIKLLESSEIENSESKNIYTGAKNRKERKYRRFNEHQMKNSYIHPFIKKYRANQQSYEI